MSSRLRDHVRHHVVGYIAIFLFAIGGTAGAVDGPLAGQNSVGSEDIINNDVKSVDISDGRIFNVDLADNLIQGGKIKDDTLTGADVDESTLSGLQRPVVVRCPADNALADLAANGDTECIPVPPIDHLIGEDTNGGPSGGSGPACVVGDIMLSAGWNQPANRLAASGQLLPISENEHLFLVIGTTYGGDGQETFRLPDLRALAPNHMTYTICRV